LLMLRGMHHAMMRALNKGQQLEKIPRLARSDTR
jgi:hypothetical protein